MNFGCSEAITPDGAGSGGGGAASLLRPSNVVSQLQKERPLLTDEDIESCKNGYNTWAFIGDIDNKPQLTCVFQSDDAQNEFLSNPKIGLGEDVYDDEKPAYKAASKAIKAGVGGFGAPGGGPGATPARPTGK